MADDESSVEQLDGVLHNGELLLVDRARRLVFDPAASPVACCLRASRESHRGQLFSKRTGRALSLVALIRSLIASNCSNARHRLCRLPPIRFVAIARKQTRSKSRVTQPTNVQSDHCETPRLAYDDVAPALRALAAQRHKSAAELVRFNGPDLIGTAQYR